METIISDWSLEQLKPFGLIVTSQQRHADLRTIPTSSLKKWTDEHRVIILRGFASLADAQLPEFCVRLGEILEWDFGAVNDLRVKPDARNYLYTNGEVPFHWDGAFAGRIPHYIFFVCDLAPAPGSGGETLFCDTSLLLAQTPLEQRERWEHTSVTYTTEKIVHYGGTFNSPMICRNPFTQEKVLRFAEPVLDLNPVALEINGIPEQSQPEFLRDMHERLHDDKVCYRHQWQEGDVVIADNYVLLHGRTAFVQNAERKIRRVNIL
jgi:alpha-ketoglutarate-dependent taurine dioxygenase